MERCVDLIRQQVAHKFVIYVWWGDGDFVDLERHLTSGSIPR